MAEKSETQVQTGYERTGAEDVEQHRVAHLIEQLQQQSAELEEANRELRRISHYRSLFLARMSHELRTPLTSILGFTEILLDQEKLTEVQRRFCQKIQNSGVQLLTSLNQLVDLSRLEAGPAELFFQEFSLRDALRETCSAVARFAQKQDLNLEYDLAPEITTIVSDRGRLRQILYTFLAWAISRSKEGQTVTVYADLLEGPMLRVKIEDEGEHVTNVRCVFDPEEGSPGREASVNELGIIIGRRLLALLRGTVTLENRGTGGLRIIIELPAGPPKG